MVYNFGKYLLADCLTYSSEAVFNISKVKHTDSLSITVNARLAIREKQSKSRNNTLLLFTVLYGRNR